MKSPRRWIAPPFDNEFPLGAKSPPPRRICIICGIKYVAVEGQGSPCNHVKPDGTTINPEPKSWRPTNEVPRLIPPPKRETTKKTDQPRPL